MPKTKRTPSIPADAIEREGRNSYLADFDLENCPSNYKGSERARWINGFKNAKHEATH